MTTTIPIPASAAQAPVHTVADILLAMSQDPEIAAAIRQHVMTQELLALPALMARMAQQIDRNTEDIAEILAVQRRQGEVQERHGADIADLKAGQERHNADIADLKAGQERHEGMLAGLKAGQERHEVMLADLKAGQERHEGMLADLKAGQERHEGMLADLKTGQERHDDDIAELKTDVADIKSSQRRVENELAELRAKATVTDARKMMGVICNAANLRGPRWMEPHDIFALIENADTTGIPGNELRSCQEADLVMRAICKDDGATQYAIVECSATITGADIRRIRRNAGHFARITGCSTHAVAIGKLPPPHILADASRQQVHCIEPSSSVTRPD